MVHTAYMALGGINGANGGYHHQQPGGGAAAGGNDAGSEFLLEKQAVASQTNSTELAKRAKKSKQATIAAKGKRNRKGAPRQVLVDGEMFEVYLLAIA